jgi:hypothetical protein
MKYYLVYFCFNDLILICIVVGQLIVNYTIHPNTTDRTKFPSHLAQHEASLRKALKVVTIDSGHGSEENKQRNFFLLN